MESIETVQIQAFLTEVGRRYQQIGTLLLLGGSALCLLGSPRPTLDIDYVGHDLHKDELQQVIDQVAQEMQLEVEAVPIDEFVPLPLDAQQRRLPVGQFGTINVYILDPYTIALSKLDRGFDTDIEDIIFLLDQGLITLDQLNTITQTALTHAQTFNLNPSIMLEHLQAVRDQL
ncbi:MAG: DUF6036 family nucleotidyltransferase [Chloroflexi bacterium]|nr:DUF6036 family nucleotidyltransferase [Chloroflexota bacterium]